jgi:hypothetical protein
MERDAVRAIHTRNGYVTKQTRDLNRPHRRPREGGDPVSFVAS